MKILILGGTGAMGIHLCNLLVERGDEVFVTSRTRSGRFDGIQYIKGNAQDENFLDHLLIQDWDTIVDFMVYSTVSFRKRYQKLLNSTKHYFFLSSARVYANSEEPITEDSPRLLDVTSDEEYLKTDEYALAKARQEDILFSTKYNNWTIIRPYITYDNERLQLGVLEKEGWLYRALNGRSIITLKEMQNKKTTLTAGKDVARSICALIGNDKAFGEVFHITADFDVTWKKILDIYIKVLHDNGYSATLVENELDSFSKWRDGKYQIYYDRLFDRTFNNKKINNFIDTSTFVNCFDGLEECLQNFIDNKPFVFKELNWREEALKDKICGEYTELKEIMVFRDKVKYVLFRNLTLQG